MTSRMRWASQLRGLLPSAGSSRMTIRPCRSIVLSLMPRCCRSQSWNWPTRRSSTGTALDEELDDLAHAPHVVAGDVLLTTLTEATAMMPREPTDDGLVDIGDRDLGQRQPMREVAGYTVIAPHRQGSMPRLQQMVPELRHPWGKMVHMHGPPGGAILIRLGHSMLPSHCR